MKKYLSQPAIQLGLFALSSAVLLATLHTVTRDRIAEQQQAQREKLLAQVLPSAASQAIAQEVSLGEEHLSIWRQIENQQVRAIALEVTAQGGYSGDIELLIGLDAELAVTGVRVTSHRETPGLGDEIEIRRSQWITAFNGRSLTNTKPQAWAVKKDGGVFDHFTGATITPRAVVAQVHQTLLLGLKYQARLFASPEKQGQ